MKPLKIAYISGPSFSDVDMSYLSYAQKEMDITYFVPIFKNGLRGAAFNLHEHFPKYGIFSAIDTYPELAKFKDIIDLSKFYVINSPATRGWQLQNIWLHIKLAWALRKYDVIHLTNFPYYYEFFLYFLRKKIILTVHDPIPHSTAACNTTQIKFNRKLGFRFLKHFIILNHKQKEECIKINKLHRKHIYESRLGSYDYLNIYKIEKNKKDIGNKYILFFGQIASNKGLDILLPAMLEFHQRMPEVNLIVAGKGNFSFDIKPFQQLDYIEFRNRFIPDDELAKLIQESLFVVCPYKDATQSGVVMSAFAFNKPVIATNVGGFPEQVLHDQYGLIVAPSCIAELSSAFVDLCMSPALLNKFEQNIQVARKSGEISWSLISSDMKSIYSSI
jgi:glycosyltransferase involved in cell wall biosynthesis